MRDGDNREWEVPSTIQENLPQRSLQEMRFAWTDNFGGVPVTTETREVLKKVALRLEELRCHLEQCNPSDFDFSEAWETFGEICGAQVVAHESALGKLQYKLLGLIGRSQNQGAFLRGISRGFGLNLRQYLDALERRDSLARWNSFCASMMGWACPVTPGPAFTHRQVSSPLGFP